MYLEKPLLINYLIYYDHVLEYELSSIKNIKKFLSGPKIKVEIAKKLSWKEKEVWGAEIQWMYREKNQAEEVSLT